MVNSRHSHSTRSIPVLVALAITLPLLLASCKTNPNAAFIESTWSFANEFNDPQATEVHLLQEWRFSAGRFYFLRELYYGFPESAQGRYRIIDSTENSVTLEFYDVDANRSTISDGTQVNLVIDQENDTLRIGRVLYDRAGP